MHEDVRDTSSRVLRSCMDGGSCNSVVEISILGDGKVLEGFSPPGIGRPRLICEYPSRVQSVFVVKICTKVSLYTAAVRFLDLDCFFFKKRYHFLKTRL